MPKDTLKARFKEPFDTDRLPAVSLGAWAALSLPLATARRFIVKGHVDHTLAHVKVVGALVVDARGKWFREESELHLVQEAYVISGQLEDVPEVPCIALLNDIPEEPPQDIQQWKYSSTAPRLSITTAWSRVTIVGDLFVQPTARGYAPALLVDTPSGDRRHVLAGARSIKDGLERLRVKFGTINALQIELRKTSADPTSPYEIRQPI